MKNCIILHGCPSDKEKAISPEKRTYDRHWIPWVKSKLEEKGIKVMVPLMPNPWAPNYLSFKKEFDKLEVNEKTILIGHSCGCAFLVRWLGETKKNISKLILVAPWKIAYRKDNSDLDFYNYPIDKKIKDRVKEIIIFTSDNEEKAGKISVKLFNESIGGKIIDLKNHGHYILDHMGTNKFPELLKELF